MEKNILSRIAILVSSAVLILSYNNCDRVQTDSDVKSILSARGVETGNPMSGIAALPKVYLDSDYPMLPSGRRILTVGKSGRDYSDCQSAINAARPGDEVVIDARFVCDRLVLPNKGSSTEYIVIRTANLAALPSQGTRISKQDAANLAVIETKNEEFAVGVSDLPANSNATSAPNHYHLVGLEIRVNPEVKVPNEYIVKLRNGGKKIEQLPHDIVISRSWIHGNPDQEIRRGVDLNGLRISIVDSIIEDVHKHGESSQGIAAWDAAVGPYKIVNNEFAVAGAAILVGWQSSIPNLISSDIEVRQNLFHKLDAWKNPVTSNIGKTGYWALSEFIVLRSVQRIIFEGNVFTNDWARIPSGSNYIGRAFWINPIGFGQSWARVQDVTITSNVMHDIPAGFAISYQDPNMPEVVAQRIHISNNVAYNLDSNNDRGFIWLQGEAQGPVVFDHNTFISNPSANPIMIMGDRNGSFSQMTFTNNIVNDDGEGILGLGSSAAGAASLATQFPEIVFRNNTLAGQDRTAYGNYAISNLFPTDLNAVGFSKNLSSGVESHKDLRLAPSSSSKNAATDGTDIGADISKILRLVP